MTNKKSNGSRRKLLKSIATGSGAIVAGKSLPESWSNPVVDSIVLPAHAQTSGNSGGSENFTNPGKKTFTVPDGTTQVTITAYGAEGGGLAFMVWQDQLTAI